MQVGTDVISGGHAAQASEPAFRTSTRYSSYVVWLLSAVYALNMVDRQLLSILLEPIKREFLLSDLAMGLLGGLAFALFYSTLGMPLARLADRSSRTMIIVVSIAVWSVFTSLTAAARTVTHLLLARIGVAAGEAGCNPAAYSLLSDYFPVQRRATALAIYQMGAVGGSFIGLVLGGHIAQAYGWRSAFLLIGLPGLLVALLVKLTVREPPRGFSDPAPIQNTAPRAARVVLAELVRKPAFRHVAVGSALHCFAVYGIGNFYSSFLIRSHGMSVAEAGSKLGVVYLIAGAIGTYLGGALADRGAQRYDDPRHYLWVPGVLLLVGFPFSQLTYQLQDPRVVMGMMMLSVAAGAGYLAPSLAATYRMVDSSERALASALLLLVLNLFGLGFGPMLAGWLSDVLNQHFQDRGIEAARAQADGLRWSLALMSLVNLWSAAHYFLAARTLRRDAIA